MSKRIQPPDPPDPEEEYFPRAHPRDLALRTEVASAYHDRNQADIRLMGAVRKVEAQRLYRREGYQTTAQWLAGYLGIGYSRCSEFVDVALALEQLPLLEEAFIKGRVSYDHLRALIQVASPDTEACLLKEVEGTSVGATFKLVDRIKSVTSEDSIDTRQERFLEKRWDKKDRFLDFWGRLPEEEGLIFEKTLDALAAKVPDEPIGDLCDYTPVCAKRADALVAMASTCSSVPGPKAQIVVHVDASVLADGEGVAELEGGPAISPATARRLKCDAVLSAVIEDADGNAVGVAKGRRTVPGWVRKVVMNRDGQCAWPECHANRALEIHHLVPRRKNGPHTPKNLVMLCKNHHILVEEGDFKIRGKPPKVKIIRPGRPPIQVGPPRLPPKRKPKEEP